MRIAAITDIHANLPALEAVLGATDAAGIEEIWCLGDVVGYGAEPDRCADLVRERCSVCLVGNHDLAVLGALDIAAFSEAAAEAVAWTRENVAARTLEMLRELEPAGRREGIALFHASPRDPVWEYVLSAEQADDCLDVQPERVALIGHSHVALFFVRPPGEQGEVRGAQAGDGALLRARRGALAAQPRQRRPAARRRSSRGLAGSRHRGGDRPLPPGRLRHRPGRGIDRRRRPAATPRGAAPQRPMTPH